MITLFLILFFLVLIPMTFYFVKNIFNFFAFMLVIIVFVCVLVNLEAYLLFAKLFPVFWESNQGQIGQIIQLVDQFYPYVYIAFIIMLGFYIFWGFLKMFMSILIPVLIISFLIHFFTDVSISEILYTLSHSEYFLVIAVLFVILLKVKNFALKYMVFYGGVFVFIWFSLFQPTFLQVERTYGFDNMNFLPKIIETPVEASDNIRTAASFAPESEKAEDLPESKQKVVTKIVLPFESY